MREYKDIMDILGNKNDNYRDMTKYGVVMECLMEKLETHNPSLFKETMERLEDIAYDIPLDKAKEIVRKMRPFGEHWSFETVKHYVESKDVIGQCVYYYLVMNMMYNDYYDVATNFGHQADTEFYFELAHAFINDEDGKKHKVERYFS